MSYAFTVDERLGLLRVRYDGEVGMVERGRAVRELMEAAARTGLDRMLIDFRSAHSRPEDPREVMRVVDAYAPQVPAQARLAYVLRYDHQLDEAFEVFARERGVRAERFLDLDAALRWLQERSPETPAAEPDAAAAGTGAVLRITTDAIGSRALDGEQVAAIDDLVRATLAAGMDEAGVRALAARIAGAMAVRGP